VLGGGGESKSGMLCNSCMTNCHSLCTSEWVCKEAGVSIKKEIFQKKIAAPPLHFEKAGKRVGKRGWVLELEAQEMFKACKSKIFLPQVLKTEPLYESSW